MLQKKVWVFSSRLIRARLELIAVAFQIVSIWHSAIIRAAAYKPASLWDPAVVAGSDPFQT